MKLFFKKFNVGFTLVETLVAVSIFSISIITMLAVLSNGISNTNYAKSKIVATYLAQEGIEYIRNMRDYYILSPVDANLGWDKFKNEIQPCGSNNGCGFNIFNIEPDVFSCGGNDKRCKLFLNNGNYNPSVGDYSGFKRTLEVEVLSSNEIRVTSTVFWKDDSSSISFSENLFNWTPEIP